MCAFTSTGAVLLALAACSDKSSPVKIANIGGATLGAAFYMHRPGGTLDDYISIEVWQKKKRKIIISISRCSFAAVKFEGRVFIVALFEADFSGKSSVGTRLNNAEQVSATVVRNVNTAPKPDDVIKLKRDGFTVIKCNLKY